jgi:hypothetical protein
MWGIDLIEILDLTSPQKVIIATRERKAPDISMYRIENKNLILNENLFFEIKKITGSELNVIMHVDLCFESEAAVRPVVELVYNALTELKGLV